MVFQYIWYVMLHHEVNFFPKTRSGISKYVISSSIYIDENAKLINLTISRKRKKIFERLKMDFEVKE